MDVLLLRIRYLFLWAMLFAGGFVSPLTFAYDGHRQATVAYDTPSPSAFVYDVAVVLPPNERENRTVATDGIFGKFAKFVAAKTALPELRISAGKYPDLA